MGNKSLPTVKEVEVVGTQPKPADLQKMEFLESTADIAITPVTYLVKIELEDADIAYTGQGFSVYVGNERIEKYAGYKDGIYFKVNDPRCFEEHAGDEIRLSLDDETVVDTGKTLQMEAVTSFSEALGMDAELPTQEQVLKGEREPR
jgi:hypothetical protein